MAYVEYPVFFNAENRQKLILTGWTQNLETTIQTDYKSGKKGSRFSGGEEVMAAFPLGEEIL